MTKIIDEIIDDLKHVTKYMLDFSEYEIESNELFVCDILCQIFIETEYEYLSLIAQEKVAAIIDKIIELKELKTYC